MKIFYSEIASNPAYFSFGYSVYGQYEAGDVLDTIYAQGFLPSALVPGDPHLFYMNRGSRVPLARFIEDNKYRRILRKFESVEPKIEVIVHAREQFNCDEKFYDFVLSYFNFRHGKGSMPRARLTEILNSPFLTHISEYRVKNTTIGYMLEVHGQTFVHAWYYAYAKKYEGKYLGSYMLFDLVRRGKQNSKEQLYLGVTYGMWMRYKTEFHALEYWDGREWVYDKENSKLKKLLSVDHLRSLVLIDEWRSIHPAFYPGGYKYSQKIPLVRRIAIAEYRYPKIFGSILIALALFVGWFCLGITLR